MRKEIIKNFTFSSITDIVASLSNFIIFLILSRVYNPSEFEYYTLTIAFISFFIIFANFGMNITILNYISKRNSNHYLKNKSYFSSNFKLVLIFSSVTSLLIIAFSSYIEYLYEMPNLGYLLNICAIYLFFYNLISYFESFYQGLRKFIYYSISNICFNLLKFLVVILNLFFLMKIENIFILFTSISCIQFFIILTIINKKENILNNFFEFDKNISKEILFSSLYIFIPILLKFLYTKFNQFLLVYYVNSQEYVSYSILLTIIQILSLPLFIFSKLTLPYASYFAERKDQTNGLDIIYNSVFKYGLLIMIPLSVYLFIFSDQLIIILFGNNYLLVANILKLIVFYFCILILDSVGGNFLWALKMPKILRNIYIINTIVSLGLSIILIPLIYSYGAIISIVIPHSCAIIFTLVKVKKMGGIIFNRKNFTYMFIYFSASMISSGLIFVIRFIFRLKDFSIMIYLLLSLTYVVIYLITIFALGGLKLKEIKEFLFFGWKKMDVNY